jgi:hypothetical protein
LHGGFVTLVKTILNFGFKGFAFLPAILVALLTVDPELSLAAGRGGAGFGGAGRTSTGAARVGSSDPATVLELGTRPIAPVSFMKSGVRLFAPPGTVGVSTIIVTS